MSALMCNLVYISTTSEDNLAGLQSELFRFEPMVAEEDVRIQNLLSYPNRWYLASRYGGCSCHYRHRMPGFHPDTPDISIPPSFSKPESWFPEEEDDLE